MIATKKSIITHIKDSRCGSWQEMSIYEKRADYKNQHDLLKAIGWTFRSNIEVQFVKDYELK